MLDYKACCVVIALLDLTLDICSESSIYIKRCVYVYVGVFVCVGGCVCTDNAHIKGLGF